MKRKFKLAAAVSAAAIILAACGGPTQEVLEQAENELDILYALRRETEEGYGALEDDALFSRVTDAGQKLDSLAQIAESGFSDMKDEDIEEAWMGEATELKDTYRGLLDLIEQTADYEEAVRVKEESRFEPVVFIVNDSGTKLENITFETDKDGAGAVCLSLTEVLDDGATLAGISLPLKTDDMDSELYIVCSGAGEEKRFYAGVVSELNADDINYITLTPEREIQTTPGEGVQDDDATTGDEAEEEADRS